MMKVPGPIVLIVEDEPLIRMLAVEAFLDVGFAILEAGDAAEALLLYQPTRPALLFTDVNMPGELNGIDLAELLHVRAPALRIIIASALPMIRPVDHLDAVVFTKPYDADAVSAAGLDLLAA